MAKHLNFMHAQLWMPHDQRLSLSSFNVLPVPQETAAAQGKVAVFSSLKLRRITG